MFDYLKECGYTEKEINCMTNNEKFKAVLDYEGFIDYDGIIKSWIRQIYKIDLNNI